MPTPFLVSYGQYLFNHDLTRASARSQDKKNMKRKKSLILSFAVLAFGASLVCSCGNSTKAKDEAVAEDSVEAVVADSSATEKNETSEPSSDASPAASEADVAETPSTTSANDSQTEKELDAQVAVANAACPMQIDQFTTMLSVSKGLDAVIYNYQVDESQMMMGEVEARMALLKSNMKSMISRHALGSAFDYFAKLCVKSNRGLHYQYHGSEGGGPYSYTITASELRALVE